MKADASYEFPKSRIFVFCVNLKVFLPLRGKIPGNVLINIFSYNKIIFCLINCSCFYYHLYNAKMIIIFCKQNIKRKKKIPGPLERIHKSKH